MAVPYCTEHTYSFEVQCIASYGKGRCDTVLRSRLDFNHFATISSVFFEKIYGTDMLNSTKVELLSVSCS